MKKPKKCVRTYKQDDHFLSRKQNTSLVYKTDYNVISSNNPYNLLI